jgi:hypothetical protein
MFLPISPTNLNGFQGFLDARTQILDALGTTLGTYTDTPNTYPAIYVVRNLDTDPPRHYKRTGLECLIFTPTATSNPLHHNALVNETWNLRLIQHDRNSSTLPAHYALLAHFPDLQRLSWLPADRDIHEQLNLIIPQSLVIR